MLTEKEQREFDKMEDQFTWRDLQSLVAILTSVTFGLVVLSNVIAMYHD